MKNIFTEHPRAVGETYLQHFWFAFSTGLQLLLWGGVAILHALFPFMFKTFVSDRVKRLYKKIHFR